MIQGNDKPFPADWIGGKNIQNYINELKNKMGV